MKVKPHRPLVVGETAGKKTRSYLEAAGVVITPGSRRRVRRGRKPFKPFFGSSLAECDEDGFRAMAKCLGMTHRMLFDQCLFLFQQKAELILGFGCSEASYLTRAQIRAIARKVRVGIEGSWAGGNAERN